MRDHINGITTFAMIISQCLNLLYCRRYFFNFICKTLWPKHHGIEWFVEQNSFFSIVLRKIPQNYFQLF